MKFYALMAVAAIAILTGCSDDTTTPNNPTPDNHLPSTAGSYWVYDIDSSEVSQAGDTTKFERMQDSVVVVGTVSMTDSKGVTKSAVMTVTYRNGLVTDTSYSSQDGAKLYSLMELGYNSGGIQPVSFGTRWVLIGDQNATSSWVALQDSLSNISFVYNNIPITGNVGIKFTGRKIGNENMTVDGNSVSTVHYALDYSVILYSAVTVPVVLTIDTWQGKEVGMVKNVVPISEINLQVAKFYTPGKVTVLARNKVM